MVVMLHCRPAQEKTGVREEKKKKNEIKGRLDVI